MGRTELVEEVHRMCAEHNIEFVDDIKIGNALLVLIRGKHSKELLDELLTDLGLEHTSPTLIVDGIGSYVTIN